MLEQHEVAALFSALQCDPPGAGELHDKAKKILGKYITHLGECVDRGVDAKREWMTRQGKPDA
jgi:hypothetical protein